MLLQICKDIVIVNEEWEERQGNSWKRISIDKIDSLSTRKDTMLDKIEIPAEFCLILVYPNLSFLLWSYNRNIAWIIIVYKCHCKYVKILLL